MTTLYNHTTELTAYITDNPHSKAKSLARYWVEKSSRGWRMFSQIQNPKTRVWQTPKLSTYYEYAGVMFLTKTGAVDFSGVNDFTSPQDILDFAKNFPRADFSKLIPYVEKYITIESAFVNNSLAYVVDGFVKNLTPQEKEIKESQIKLLKQTIQLIKKV